MIYGSVRWCRVLSGVVVAVVTALPHTHVCAQCSYEWLPGDGVPGVTGAISGSWPRAMTTWDPDGKGPQSDWLVIGGNFTLVDNVSVGNIVAWDGATWHALNGGMNNEVHSMTAWDPDGDGPDPTLLICTGNFTIAGGVPANHIAAWDGMRWRAFPNTPASNITVYNGDLIGTVGTGQQYHGHICRWNGSAWVPLGDVFNHNISDLAVYKGELIAGGLFNISTSQGPASYVARWNGQEWLPLGNSGYGQPHWVFALAVYRDELVAGRVMGYIDAWDGEQWHSVGGGVNSDVYDLEVYNDELIAAGDFTYATGGLFTKGIARWNGSSWQSLSGGMSGGTSDTMVRSMTVFNGELIAGGDFRSAGGVNLMRLARWDGDAWHAYGSGMNNTVEALTIYQNDLIAGGRFTTAGAGNAGRIARWDGTRWHPLGSGLSFTPAEGTEIRALTAYDGDLIAGGKFITAGGNSANYIARWDGANWHPMGSGMALPSSPELTSVRSLIVHGGNLVAGGVFTIAGGVSATGIARWDGVKWHPLGNLNGAAVALTIYEGDLIAGGSFTIAGGASGNRVARWDGVKWGPMGSGINNGSVSALTVYNGDLIAAGNFMSGTTPNGVARWDGSTWVLFGDGLGSNGVRALAVYNGELIAGGLFFTNDYRAIARWNGSMWQSLGTGMSNPGVWAIAVFDCILIAGGQFVHASGQPSAFWARWGRSTSLCTVADIAPTCGDCQVNHLDLLLVLQNWGTLGPNVPADITGDGVVNINDLLAIINGWGPCD